MDGFIIDILTNIIAYQKSDVVALIVYSTVVIFLMLLVKNVLGSIVYYVFFRMNERIAIGAAVKLNNEEYIIRKIGFFKIELENDEGYLQVPMSRWTYSNFKILKNREK
ncbi:MAG: hypothetical protein ACOCSL_02360 [Thermoplasmatota archaeon]